jgi:amino acid transporter
MSRYVPHAAVFYALLARGLGGVCGVVGGALALLAYNAIQISLYGLFGFTVAGSLGGSWWLWAAAGLAVIAALGLLRVVVNARVLAWLLVLEIGVIVLFDLGAFTHPAGGTISAVPLQPGRLAANGVGGVFAFGIAAFVGYEAGPVFGEEARSRVAVSRATFAALAFLGGFYAVSSWAMAVAVGPNRIVNVARDPQAGLPFSVLEQVFGPAAAWLGKVLLITSIFAAMLSFHNTVARYLFALGREHVLPGWLARIRTGTRGGAPVGGSLVQSGIAAVVVAGFAVAGADPITALFTWAATVAAVGILVLLIAASAAARSFFGHGQGSNEGRWVRVASPTLGVLGGVVVLVATVVNLDSLLGIPKGSARILIIPGIVVATIAAGLGWGLLLRRRRPAVFDQISLGRPDPLLVPEHRLADVDV